MEKQKLRRKPSVMYKFSFTDGALQLKVKSNLTNFKKLKNKTKMKTTIKLIIAIIFLANISFANNPGYKLNVTNVNYTAKNSLEFDIYLMSSNMEELRYSLGQYFFEFNPKIANGGNLTYTIVSSELPESMRPRNASVSDNLLRLAVNSPSSDKSNLPVIPNQKPGLLIAKMKLETSADQFAEAELDLKLSTGQFQSKVFTFADNRNVEVTNSETGIAEVTDGSEISSTETLAEIPTEYSLSQNYPNPFNPSTTIKFGIPSNVNGQTSNVRLIVYDLTGRVIATLVNEPLQAGYHEYKFDAGSFASGIYFYKITAGSFSVVKKMMLIK